MRISGNPAALAPAVGDTLARRTEQVGSPTTGTGSSASVRPTVAGSGVGGPDPAEVMTRAAHTHRASQVVAAQNTQAVAAFAAASPAALSGLLPMPG